MLTQDYQQREINLVVLISLSSQKRRDILLTSRRMIQKMHLMARTCETADMVVYTSQNGTCPHTQLDAIHQQNQLPQGWMFSESIAENRAMTKLVSIAIRTTSETISEVEPTQPSHQASFPTASKGNCDVHELNLGKRVS